MSSKITTHARAHVMYMAMYVRRFVVLYTAMYVCARRLPAVRPFAIENPAMFSGRQYLRAAVLKVTVQHGVNLVPQCPAIVPQSKCFTAGLAVVASQRVTSLVPQCPAITAPICTRTGVRTHAHTRTRIRTRRMAQWEVPRDCAGLTQILKHGRSGSNHLENDNGSTRTIAIQDRNEERLVSRLWLSSTNRVRRHLASAECGTRTRPRQESIIPSSLPSLPADAGRSGSSRGAVRSRVTWTPRLAHVGNTSAIRPQRSRLTSSRHVWPPVGPRPVCQSGRAKDQSPAGQWFLPGENSQERPAGTVANHPTVCFVCPSANGGNACPTHPNPIRHATAGTTSSCRQPRPFRSSSGIWPGSRSSLPCSSADHA